MPTASSCWSNSPRGSAALKFWRSGRVSRSPTPRSISSTCGARVSWQTGATASSSTIGSTDDTVLELLAALRRIAERNIAEVERVIRSYFDKRDSLEAVSRAELVERARAGTITILDVRPDDEFALGHLPGALNIPLRELEARLGEIDPKQEIVAYCRGPYCVLSYEAVAQLRTRGFKVRRLEDGLPEWRAAGLPVVTGSA